MNFKIIVLLSFAALLAYGYSRTPTPIQTPTSTLDVGALTIQGGIGETLTIYPNGSMEYWRRQDNIKLRSK
jgi:hypothetical protein